ncbi:MAG: hypothetical protein KDC72_00330 [Bacteroidetes bacterium]|nr:hypothetical protein [Bacteroidota bacterium]
MLILMLFIDDQNSRGLFGDSFGGLNALVSSLALGGIIYTIIIQRKELNIQKEELITQRKEYQITRITNIVYHEVNKCKNSIDKIILKNITSANSVHDGDNSFKVLCDHLNKYLDFEKEPTQKKRRYFKYKNEEKFTKELENIIINNVKSFDGIFHQVYNSCRIINLTLLNEDIDYEDKEELKTIFILNLGINFTNAILFISPKITEISEENESLRHFAYRLLYIQNFQGKKNQYDSATTCRYNYP